VRGRSNFRRFLGYLKPYRWRASELLFWTFVSALLGLPMPVLLGIAVDRVPGLVKDGNVQEAWHVVAWTVGVRIALGIAASVLSLRHRALTLSIGQRLIFDLRQQLYRHLQRLSMRYYETMQTGQIMSRVLWDVEAVQAISTGQLAQLIVDFVRLVVIATYLFIRDWRIGLLTCIVLPLYVINYYFFRSKIHEVAAETREKFSQITGSLQEKVAGARIVKSFVRERSESRQFVHETRENLFLNIRLGLWSGGLNTTASFISDLGTQLAVLYCWYRVVWGQHMTAGDVVVISSFVAQMYGPVLNITTINDAIVRASTALDRIFGVLDTTPDVEEIPDALPVDSIEGRIEFRDVYFSYQPDELVLKNVNFVAEPGTVNALVGPSGGGKSTIINLIPRFYDPIAGEVLLDGVPLTQLRLNALRQQIGIVLQETFLFTGTIKENIKYGKPDARDEQVEAAAKAANAHEFILEQRDGYETEIGERGLRLSGGQKQRIAIARAILRDPKILILDEATSALDSESEHLIQQALDTLMANRTTFAIAHRLSTVMNADQILVIDGGEVIERGTHVELVQMGGRYQKLAEIQFKAPTAEPPREERQEDDPFADE